MTQRPLTEPQRLVLAEIKRLNGRASTGTLRRRGAHYDWGFDPRNVVRNLAKRGLLDEHWTALTHETNWVLTEEGRLA